MIDDGSIKVMDDLEVHPNVTLASVSLKSIGAYLIPILKVHTDFSICCVRLLGKGKSFWVCIWRPESFSKSAPNFWPCKEIDCFQCNSLHFLRAVGRTNSCPSCLAQRSAWFLSPWVESTHPHPQPQEWGSVSQGQKNEYVMKRKGKGWECVCPRE